LLKNLSISYFWKNTVERILPVLWVFVAHGNDVRAIGGEHPAQKVVDEKYLNIIEALRLFKVMALRLKC
jgi:hypothetical protein